MVQISIITFTIQTHLKGLQIYSYIFLMKIASICALRKKRFTKNTCILLDNFPESCVLRQRCPGRRSWGCTRRGHRIRASKISSDTLATANILEHAEPRACLASDYLIREIVWREIQSRFSHPRAGRAKKPRGGCARNVLRDVTEEKSETTFFFESSILNWNLLDHFRFDVSQAFADWQTRYTNWLSIVNWWNNIIYVDYISDFT